MLEKSEVKNKMDKEINLNLLSINELYKRVSKRPIRYLLPLGFTLVKH